jgi:excisionase family DNA binding protein
MTDRLLYTVPEAADVLSLGSSKVYELVAAGTIESVKIGRARRVPAEALERFVAQLGDDDDDTHRT